MTQVALIAGNSLAAMVAALELANAGQPVRLLNADSGWGGHLGGVRLDGRQFDGGMVLLEFGAFNTEDAPDLQGYDPGRRNDCGRFAARVGRYIEALLPCHEIPVPQILHEGRLHDDPVIANRLAILRNLDPALANRIRAELQTICSGPRSRLHAASKNGNPQFLGADLESASIANHGPTLHGMLFEPICRKIAGCPARDVVALYHRVPWLPLFHPETLLSQFGPSPAELQPTRFHYPRAGASGALIDTLAGRITDHPNIEIIKAPPQLVHQNGDRIEVRLADGRSISTGRFAWSLDPGLLLGLVRPAQAIAPLPRAPIGLCFLTVPQKRLRRRFSTAFVPLPSTPIYRLTDQEVCAGSDSPEHRIVVEFRPEPGVAYSPTTILAELADLGFLDTQEPVTSAAVKVLGQALMKPDWHNMRTVLGQIAWVRELVPAARLMGASAGFFASSLNDQVVQGLQLAETWNARQ